MSFTSLFYVEKFDGFQMQSTFFIRTLLGFTIPVVLNCLETCPKVVLNEILVQVPECFGKTSRIICGGKNLLECVNELSLGVEVFFNKLAAIYIIAESPEIARNSRNYSNFKTFAKKPEDFCQSYFDWQKSRELNLKSRNEVNKHRVFSQKKLQKKSEKKLEVDRLKAELVEKDKEYLQNSTKLLERISELEHTVDSRTRIIRVLLTNPACSNLLKLNLNFV